VFDSNSANFGSLGNWPFWQGVWNRNNGYPKDGPALFKTRKYNQYRVPLRPPVVGPSFGYYQPCWKQLPTASRCLTCDVLPGNRGVATLEIPDLLCIAAAPSAATAPQIPPITQVAPMVQAVPSVSSVDASPAQRLEVGNTNRPVSYNR
jgi:hypothetical protein